MKAALTKGSPARLRIDVRGIVQGVGFRPFVYRLAHKYNLSGWVRNTSGNVTIEVEGRREDIDSFLLSLKNEAPPVARVQDIKTGKIHATGQSGFVIQDSEARAGEYQPVSPDIVTCAQCLKEIFDPADRRYLYPFTNCTNCGPRFTIIKDIPYDRPLTTMSKFRMCPECQAEYDDPLDRRFHAQPNACPKCGPSLQLTDGEDGNIACKDIPAEAARLLCQGNILAVKGMGGFQLACDATSREAVLKLRQRKKRPGKPFALMMASIEDIKKHCTVSPEEEGLLLSAQAPIVLLRWNKDISDVTDEAAKNNKYLGVMLPSTPLHHILTRYARRPLVMTSGNLSEEPICRDNDEALRRLAGIADYFILHDRDIYSRYDDSVFMVAGDRARAVRRARGYAPSPILLPRKAVQILACGADEKNAFCLTRDENAFLSQHIGDMDNTETLEHFQNTLELYRRLFRVEPELIVHDLHPEYNSTKYALALAAEKRIKTLAVQHHHAHIASCLLENAATGPVIGVAFDGTGYGSDGRIWGGEFLVGEAGNLKRMAHLEYVPMPGGESAIRKPYRMALGYISCLLGRDTPIKNLPILGSLPDAEVEVIRKQIEKSINTPLTSSAGRLFDAVSALAGIRGEITYEAQAAIELEMSAPDDISGCDPYPFAIEPEGDMLIIKLKGLIAAVMEDVGRGAKPSVISGRFHLTMAEIIARTCLSLSKKTGIKEVALSGGVFQNRLLFSLVMDKLEKQGFRVHTHRAVPTNDGCIALGQVAVALAREGLLPY